MMMKANGLVLFLFSLIFFSCNRDVQIVQSKDNSECRRLATCFTYLIDDNKQVGREYSLLKDDKYYFIKNEISMYGDRMGWYPISESKNRKILSKAKSLSVKNFSKTKVYSVRIQRTCRDGEISYTDYILEPLAVQCIGCDTDFDIKIKDDEISIFSYTSTNKPILNYEGEIKKAYEANYEIHNVKLISEY